MTGCGKCERLGFACVDHATPAPCTAEGGCYPARPTFGWYKPNWRRWPGTETGGPSPSLAGEQDELVPPYEEPSAEDEDRQAPPPIEDEPSPGDEVESAEGESGPAGPRPGVEINLPSLPEPPSLPRPGLPRPGLNAEPTPAGEDGPPALPFGLRAPGFSRPQEACAPQPAVPTALPNPRGETPPPLPQGFTAVGPTGAPRRLPSIGAYLDDRAVRPASAQLPVGASPWSLPRP
jgi:hypothetical protein